jgi:hypothetical protein
MGAGNAADDLEQVIERYHLALGEFMRGNYEHTKQLFSERDDVTLGNLSAPSHEDGRRLSKPCSAPHRTTEKARPAASTRYRGTSRRISRASWKWSASSPRWVDVRRLRQWIFGSRRSFAEKTGAGGSFIGTPIR